MVQQKSKDIQKKHSEHESVLDQILTEGKLARDEAQQDRAKDLVSEFVSQIMEGEVTASNDSLMMINQRIAQIDRILSDQLNEIMHHEEFQKLEGSWRGLSKMVTNCNCGTEGLQIRVFNASKKELLKDFDSAGGFDQSKMFKSVYEKEFGTLGGAPYGVLIGDFEFSRKAQDIELLRHVSKVAAAAHAPFISSASSKLLDLDSFADLDKPRDLSKVFSSTEMAKWRSFRESEDSRYVALTMPHVLGRLPYGEDNPVENINFIEEVDGSDHSKYLWSNAAWELGAKIIESYELYGWCAAIRGVEGGGKIENLPLHSYRTKDGESMMKCPTEISITDRREKELSDQGLISLCHAKGTDYSVFFSGQTANKPKKYVGDAANANARLSAMLPYILATSRFAHYLKAIMRDKVGSFQSRSSIEKYLNNWIAQYIVLDDDAAPEIKAKFPLREAKVDVVDVPGKPGCYNAVVHLRPHFQLEELSASLRLVAELPQSAAN